MKIPKIYIGIVLENREEVINLISDIIYSDKSARLSITETNIFAETPIIRIEKYY